MSDEGDKTCPLCAEEMDLTDQQLKPCKCGYEICVWCWHHIMDMAEKDETEGRCPACRTPYNKEKIVGTAASCGRVASEMNVEKRKPQKGKSKTSEGRKQLASVRVIQRNLVYVVGLPLNFADKDLLQRKEYFGRYGKVLKVSISRTATGAIQHFANSTCSVYITYSKEDEAVRCIQAVHGFVLDGRPLRACFGTTKYCHAWLRNMPCSNPECLYLHEIGSQEDSFTKDEIISAYTRSRVQQITGSSNSTQRRSGNILPPSADEYCNNLATSGKPITKSAVNTHNSAINARVSPPNSSCGRSSALPAGASWGTRASSNQPTLGSTQCSNEPVKQKPDVYNGPASCSTAAASPSQFSLLRSDTGKMLVPNEECAIPQDKIKIGTLEPRKKESDSDGRTNISESSSGSAPSGTLPLNRQSHGQPATELPPIRIDIGDSSLMPDALVTCSTAAAGTSQSSSSRRETGKCKISQDNCKIETSEPWKKESDEDRKSNVSESSFGSVHSAALPLNRQALGQPATEFPLNTTNTVDSSLTPNAMASDKETVDASDGSVEDMCSDILSVHIDENKIVESVGGRHISEIVTSQSSEPSENTSREVGLGHVQPDLSLSMPTHVTQVDLPEIEDDLLSFEKQRITDPEFAAVRKPDFSPASHHLLNHSNIRSSHFNNVESLISVDLGTQFVDRIGNLINTSSNISSQCLQSVHKIPEVNDVEYSNLVPSQEKRLHPGRSSGELVSGAFDIGESSIISNILSMDFDSLDEPLTSPQNLAKLLGETDKRQCPLGVSGSLKIHNSSQSRFSFAREEPVSQGSDDVNSVSYFEQGFKQHPLGHDFSSRNNSQLEKLVSYNGFPVMNGVESDIFTGNHCHLSLNRLFGSRSQVSAPPGFSAPSRAPPPGFASHERREQNLETVSGNHMLDLSSLLRNHYQAPSGGNNTSSNGDIELIDPAILAVGKGMPPSGIPGQGIDLSYSPQLSTFEEARFQSFLQRSLPQHANQRFNDLGDGYSSLGDPYRIPSRVMEQTLTNGLSLFSQFTHPQSRSGITSNGPWDGWNEFQGGNNLGVAELLRAEKLGFNKFYGSYEDSKIRMPSSGNVYDGTYGI